MAMSTQTLRSSQNDKDRPKTSILEIIPQSWIPYAELMRLHKPIGILNIFFPMLFGALYAACVTTPLVSPPSLLSRLVALFNAAFILRSAGCTWNDIIDRDLDRLVKRTRSRPMARGAVTLPAGYMFTAAQAAIYYLLLFRIMPSHRLLYIGPQTFLVWVYPFAKRYTDYAQLVLGVTLSWGVLIGAVTMGIDPLVNNGIEDRRTDGLAGLCLTYIVWTVIHDIIYAHQDVQDDLKAGIKSMAVRLLGYAKSVLWILAVVQLGILAAIGSRIEANRWYYLSAVGGNVVTLAAMIGRVDLDDPQDCLWWFQVGSLLVGVSIGAALSGEYVVRSTGSA